MERIDTGGPAFPFEGGDNNMMAPDTGMTLRDYFAAKAMQALISKTPPTLHSSEADISKITGAAARGAYDYADAMINAR